LYTMHKGQHLLIFIMFLCLFFIAVLMGLAGPSMTMKFTMQASTLKGPNNQTKSKLPGGPFNLITPDLSSYQQQLWLSAKLITKVATEQETFTKMCSVTLKVSGIRDEHTSKVIGDRVHNRTRVVRCADKSCDSFIVMHLGVLYFPRYSVNVTIYGLETVDKHFNIEDIHFIFETFNPQFTRMELWFRFFFAIVTAVVSLAFLTSLRGFAMETWSIEQKWVAFLLPALLGFNNPLFAWTILSNSVGPAFIDAFFQTSFLFGLLLFWLCIFHGLRETERGLYRFYLPKFLMVGTLWFAALTMALLQESNELRDPSFSYQINTAHYQNFQFYVISMLAMYVLYFVYLALRAFGELRAMNFLDARLKFHAASLTLVLILTISIVAKRYGSGMLEDNLVARVYTSYETEGHFLAFYTVLNCYVYLLAYVYSPTSTQAKDTHVMRDNPAFSMVHESDEETEAMLQQPDSDTSHELLHHGHGNNKSRKQNHGGLTKQQQHPPSLVNLGNDDDSD